MIGFLNGCIFDERRGNWSGAGPRPIRWNAWYPIENSGHRNCSSVSEFFLSGLLVSGAPIAEAGKKLPLILFSHGTGGSVMGLTWLAEALVEAGCIVVGANHHGNTGEEEYRAEGFICWWERIRDLSVLLDNVLTSSTFKGRIDEDRISATGFSLGGYTVLGLLGAVTHMEDFQHWAEGRPWGRGPREFPDVAYRVDWLLKESGEFRSSWDRQSLSYRDSRVCGVLALAPAPTVRGFSVSSLTAIQAPATIAVGQADEEAPANDCAVWLHSHLPNSSLHLLGDHVGHYTLLAMGTPAAREAMPHLFTDHAAVDRSSVHKQVIKLAKQSVVAAP